ncbi:hypothetical protein AYO20_06375 [Fonsecaea nubica]|uniref:Interferon-induced 6-16 n=1 Tax=Fonsecaea nubica TaxID=856822 RepID=A0A178CYH6_9EURO|nr:hypothetical protein AYO20_06375 [Fonsecaea nubica]OAL34322.1 hypothetical protein AYO20_06375 [Fonsecaea nubica]
MSAPALLREGSRLALTASKSTAKAITDHGPKAAAAAAAWTVQNPGLAACGAVGTVGIILIAAPGVVVVPVLAELGFGAGGVVAGTTAATMQAGIGNVAAGSAFAVAQSAGAAGSGLAVINGVVQVAGFAMTAGSGGLAWIKSKVGA